MRHIEDSEQAALIEWADRSTINGIRVGRHLLHIPNGGKRNAREAARLKRQGVRAGVPDLFLALPRGPAAGLFIEMKAAKGRTSEKQQEWLNRLALAGYATHVCHGFDAARRVITAYLETA
jgi:hypothetical protein